MVYTLHITNWPSKKVKCEKRRFKKKVKKQSEGTADLLLAHNHPACTLNFILDLPYSIMVVLFDYFIRFRTVFQASKHRNP